LAVAPDGNRGTVTGFLEDYGLVVLFFVIALQASGVGGLPGKTALVVAAILAANGRFDITEVLVVAAVAAALGGYSGYAIGRTGLRRILQRPFFARRLRGPVETAERFFAEHGGKAVLAARFLPGLKVVAGLAAGLSCMRWRAFVLWHTLAAIAFSLVFGLTAYWAGAGAVDLAERYGAALVVALAGAGALGWLAYRTVRRRPRHVPG
jgi:membrane protein DedA with SNARE-associated domain